MSIYLTIIESGESHELYMSSTDPDDFEDFEMWEKDALKVFSSSDAVKVSVHRSLMDNVFRASGISNILWRD